MPATGRRIEKTEGKALDSVGSSAYCPDSMDDRRKPKGATKRISGRDGVDAVVHQGDAIAVCDDRPSREVRPISQEAKSRRFVQHRLESPHEYARFAAAAGVDIFDGEPIERFAAVGKMDERTLRMRAQELRERMFAEMIMDKPKRIGG